MAWATVRCWGLLGAVLGAGLGLNSRLVSGSRFGSERGQRGSLDTGERSPPAVCPQQLQEGLSAQALTLRQQH